MNNIVDYARPLTERELEEIIYKTSHCMACGQPCGIIHDFELSACCGADVEFR